jgi:hypothetical protein
MTLASVPFVQKPLQGIKQDRTDISTTESSVAGDGAKDLGEAKYLVRTGSGRRMPISCEDSRDMRVGLVGQFTFYGNRHTRFTAIVVFEHNRMTQGVIEFNGIFQLKGLSIILSFPTFPF